MPIRLSTSGRALVKSMVFGIKWMSHKNELSYIQVAFSVFHVMLPWAIENLASSSGMNYFQSANIVLLHCPIRVAVLTFHGAPYVIDCYLFGSLLC